MKIRFCSFGIGFYIWSYKPQLLCNFLVFTFSFARFENHFKFFYKINLYYFLYGFFGHEKKNIPDTLCSRRGVVIAIKLFEIEEQHDWKGFVTARGLHNGAKQFLKSYLNCNEHGLRTQAKSLILCGPNSNPNPR